MYYVKNSIDYVCEILNTIPSRGFGFTQSQECQPIKNYSLIGIFLLRSQSSQDQSVIFGFKLSVSRYTHSLTPVSAPWISPCLALPLIVASGVAQSLPAASSHRAYSVRGRKYRSHPYLWAGVKDLDGRVQSGGGGGRGQGMGASLIWASKRESRERYALAT